MRNNCYVFFELREYIAEYGQIDPNDYRFIVLNASNLGKISLLDPKLYIKDKDNLEKICILLYK